MADALDVLSLAEAKAALNITSTSQDTELAGYITTVSRQLDELVGPVVQRSITSESRDGGCRSIDLFWRPVVSVEAVVEYNGTAGITLTSESHTSQAGNQYLIDLAKGVLRRRTGGGDSWFPRGRQNVVVTYTAGRYTSASVDEQFKKAATLMLTNLWRNEQGGGTETFGGLTGQVVPGFALPNAVLDILSGTVKAPNLA